MGAARATRGERVRRRGGIFLGSLATTMPYGIDSALRGPDSVPYGMLAGDAASAVLAPEPTSAPSKSFLPNRPRFKPRYHIFLLLGKVAAR